MLLVLVGIELVMRGAEEKLSADIAHIRSGGGIADRIAAGPGTSLLLLGNSLTREGLWPDVLASGLAGDLRVEAYHPDGSSVNEWAYAYRRFFAKGEKAPGFLIIGAGRSHLCDSDLPPDSFGAYYCDTGDIPRYFRRHVKNLDDASGFLLARYSAAYANRHRVQPRVFTAIVPHYQEALQRMQAKPRTTSGGDGREVSHRNLAELLECARAAGTRVAVVAIPMPEPYPLPETTIRVIADGGATLIDARDIPGIGRASFPDQYHLGPDGAQILTEHIISRLQPLWWPHTNHGN